MEEEFRPGKIHSLEMKKNVLANLSLNVHVPDLFSQRSHRLGD